mmetsp:Transcript_60340/g.95809  ORF Transcript_60340/g.95809 Transcript_60340/m.95809 type:complete len:533 (+) Transcript_60340:32-1630(+)
MELWAVVMFIIMGVLILVIIGAVYWYYRNNRAGRAIITYNTADNYSELESEVKFKDSKNTKIWIGQTGLGTIIAKQKNELLREQYEAYAAAMKVAKNWCNLSNMQDSDNERKMADDLPCIGHRQFSKFFHPMFDEKYGSQRITSRKVDNKRLLLYHYDMDQLPAINACIAEEKEDIQVSLGDCRLFDNLNDEQYRAFRLIFETLEHPYIMRSYEINISNDKRRIFVIRDLEKEGSLRDHIHSADLSKAYSEKYSRPGKPLYINRIRKYGRQILEAVHYLSQCGLMHYHLHSGNVIIQNDNAKLTEMENLFFGYQLRHPLHQHLQAVKKIYPELNVEVCLFGYVLFEMATGIESPTPSPLDCMHELPRKLDANIVNLLGRIFGDRSLGNTPSVEDLINDPFFNATNVPRGDVSLFTALKNENEMVNKMVKAVLMQCFYTYSSEALLGQKTPNVKRSSAASGGQKKKKKKKRKKHKDKKEKVHDDDEDEEEMSVSKVVDDEKDEEEVDAKPAGGVFSNPNDEDEDSEDDPWSSQ